MGFDDISNTGLQLGLGLGLSLHGQLENCKKTNDHYHRQSRSQKKLKEEDPSACNKVIKAYPSLSLAPPDDDDDYDEANNQLLVSTKTESDEDFGHPQASSPSAMSSFSNSPSNKREMDQFNIVGEEIELEVEKLPSSRVLGDLDENGNPRKKLRLTKEQSAVLEDSFKEHSTLNPKQKQELARKLNLRARQVEVWFQNRRARTKLKQTEQDCELLKKCCETLTEENKRLQKEVQELKSVKAETQAPAGALYMQLPVASLSICPSCQRICGGINGSSPTAPLLSVPKAHLHNRQLYKNNYPFTHSSAAC